MSKDLLSLSSAQLRRVITIKDKIEALTKELNAIVGLSKSDAKPVKTKHKMSAAGRARIAAAQKARWAKVKAGKK